MAGDAVLLAGGGRAILLQLADPRVGHGVARHSDFAARPLDRLHGTMTYLYAIVDGTPEESAFVRRHVDRAHGPVHSDRHAEPDADDPARDEHGELRYDAFDRDAQLWVAATLWDSAVRVWERVHGPLDPDHAETVYRQYSVVGTSLQVPASAWPADRAAFDRWWADRVARLHVDDEARAVARDLLHPRSPLWLRLVMPVAGLVTTALLPAPVREAYGLPWDARRARRADLVLDVLARVWPHVPSRLRTLPRDRYLAGLRRRMRED